MNVRIALAEQPRVAKISGVRQQVDDFLTGHVGIDV